MGAGQRGTTARSSGDAAAQSEIFPEKEKIVEPNGEKAGTHGGEKQGENLGTHSERSFLLGSTSFSSLRSLRKTAHEGQQDGYS